MLTLVLFSVLQMSYQDKIYLPVMPKDCYLRVYGGGPGRGGRREGQAPKVKIDEQSTGDLYLKVSLLQELTPIVLSQLENTRKHKVEKIQYISPIHPERIQYSTPYQHIRRGCNTSY
jgi:hypothetical protein